MQAQIDELRARVAKLESLIYQNPEVQKSLGMNDAPAPVTIKIKRRGA